MLSRIPAAEFNDAQRLHAFARDTCMTRFHDWVNQYAALGDGRTSGGYTDAAYAIFPRYNVLSAILQDIETLDPDVLPEFAELQRLLVLSAQTAQSDSTDLSNETAQRAMALERGCVAMIVANVTDRELSLQAPLFYRRVLDAGEVEAWRGRLKAAFGADTEGYWYPLGEKTHPSLVPLIFPDAYEPLLAMDFQEIEEPDLQARLRAYFAAHDVKRVIELREYGPNYEVEAGAEDLFYSGAEGFWTSAACDWIVYCSHERTVTLGGAITAILE